MCRGEVRADEDAQNDTQISVILLSYVLLFSGEEIGHSGACAIRNNVGFRHLALAFLNSVLNGSKVDFEVEVLHPRLRSPLAYCKTLWQR